MIDWLSEKRPWFASYLNLSVLLLFCFSFADSFNFLLSFYFHLLIEGTFKTTWSGKGKAYGEPCHISNPAY